MPDPVCTVRVFIARCVCDRGPRSHTQLAARSAVRRRRPLPECVEAGLCTPALQWVLRFLRSLLLHHFSSRGAGNYVGHYHTSDKQAFYKRQASILQATSTKQVLTSDNQLCPQVQNAQNAQNAACTPAVGLKTPKRTKRRAASSLKTPKRQHAKTHGRAKHALVHCLHC